MSSIESGPPTDATSLGHDTTIENLHGRICGEEQARVVEVLVHRFRERTRRDNGGNDSGNSFRRCDHVKSGLNLRI